jgi:ferric-dicitrate binding protein FerR (iron transport regulator)
MREDTELWASLDAVLNGTPSGADEQNVAQWLKEDENNLYVFEHLRKSVYNESMEKRSLLAKERIYYKTRSKIRQKQVKRTLRLWRYIAAASVAVLIGMGGLWLFHVKPVDSPVVETRSPLGATSKITLSDGSEVSLNAGSTIRYPVLFRGSQRVIQLEGEACFQVAKDAKHPFIVETGNMKITVSGTQFNVKSYGEDERIITTLLEGSVRVDIADSRRTEPVRLSPGQQVVYDRSSDRIVVKDVKADLYASWRNRQYYCDNERFEDIIRDLGRHFGIRIRIVSPQLQNQMFSGFFAKDDTLRQMLDIFKKHRNFDYRQVESGIEIYENEE